MSHHRTFEILTAEPVPSRRKPRQPRHRSDEEKARLVAEAFSPEGNVSAVARSEGLDQSGLPTERLLAYIAVSKYADGLPLYRQETIYLRDGVELSRSLMAQWMGHLPLTDPRFQALYMRTPVGVGWHF